MHRAEPLASEAELPAVASPTGPLSARRLLQRAAGILTWRRACVWAAVLCTILLVAYAYELMGGSPPLNASGVPLGGDYIAFQAAGRLVLDGRAADLYDQPSIASTEQQLVDGRLEHFYDAFRNPPFFALVFVPLATLPLLPGFVAWTVLSLACLGLALWLLLQETPELQPRWRGLLLLVLAFAPVYFGVIDGENASLSLLLYVLVYRALARQQDAFAGVWAALGLFKPQLFFVLPLLFVATRRWRALLAYLGVTVLLALVSLALVGPAGLQAWLSSVLQAEAGNAERNAWRMASLKAFFDQLLPGQPTLSLALFILASLALLGLLLHAWHRTPSAVRALWPVTCLVAVLIDPHLVDYDLTVLVSAGVLGSALVRRSRWWIALLYGLLVFRPQVPVGPAAVSLTTLGLVAITSLWFTDSARTDPVLIADAA